VTKTEGETRTLPSGPSCHLPAHLCGKQSPLDVTKNSTGLRTAWPRQLLDYWCTARSQTCPLPWEPQAKAPGWVTALTFLCLQPYLDGSSTCSQECLLSLTCRLLIPNGIELKRQIYKPKQSLVTDFISYGESSLIKGIWHNLRQTSEQLSTSLHLLTGRLPAGQLFVPSGWAWTGSEEPSGWSWPCHSPGMRTSVTSLIWASLPPLSNVESAQCPPRVAPQYRSEIVLQETWSDAPHPEYHAGVHLRVHSSLSQIPFS
jgi:hypothetical protein